MDHHDNHQPDYGTGQKKLSVYLVGLVSCSILTVLSFWVVIAEKFSRGEIFFIIYASAFVQFIVQLICFLRLNTQTEQSRTNVMSLIFTAVILMSVIIGSLWIMWNLGYYMMH